MGEFLTLRGAFEANVVWGVLGTIGIILGAAYMLWLYQRVFFGQVTNKANEGLKDLDAREAWQFAPLIILIFWIGVYPAPLVSYFTPQTEAVVAQVQPDYFKTAPAAQRVAEDQPRSGSGSAQSRTGAAAEPRTGAPEGDRR